MKLESTLIGNPGVKDGIVEVKYLSTNKIKPNYTKLPITKLAGL
jgi:hypothetical protein